MSSLPTATLGTLLKRYRRAAGLTQEALAEQAGISADTISELERGVNLRPRSDTIDRLADALALAPPQRTQLQAAVRGLLPSGEPAVVPLRLAAASTFLRPLVGREQELARLARYLAGDGPPLLLLAGEPGIGKSRLLDEVRHQASQVGWSVLEGGCHRKSGQEPFTPLLTALAGSLHNTSPVALRTRLEGCAWLVRLLPELAETRLVPAPSWTLPPEQEQRLMFAAVARYLANVAGSAGTLLVLDDLQWAGADALDLLASLLRTPGEQPLRVVGAYRSTEVRTSDPLGVLLADLGGSGLAEEVRLGPLVSAEANALLQSVLEGQQGADHPLRLQLIERAGGVPYFLVSCAEALRAGALEGGARSVPWNVAQSIRQRVAMLPQEAQEVLFAAAIAGRSTPRPLLVTVAGAFGQSQREVLSALEAACQARLLVEAGIGGYAFPHDLVREVVLGDLSAARQAALHQQVAEALEQVPARRRGPPAAELAWHWQEAGYAERALPYALRAGEQAEAVYAHQDAERHYQTARDLARELGDQRQEAAALEQLGFALRFQGRFPQALEVLEQALALYQATGEVEGQGRVLTLIGHRYVYAGMPEVGVARLQPLVGPLCTAGLSPGGQSALLTTLSWLYVTSADYSATMALNSEALSAAEQAEALAQQAQDERLLGQARMRRGVALVNLEREEEGVQVLEDAIRLLEASEELAELHIALFYVSELYQDQGKYDLALAATERALTIARRLGDLEGIVNHQRRCGDIRFALGQWEQARQDCEQVITLLPEAHPSGPLFLSHLRLGLLSLAQGQAEAAAKHLQSSLDLAERGDHPAFLILTSCAMAYQDLEEGRPEAVQARLEPFLNRSSSPGANRAWVRHLLSWAAVELGDLEQAEALLAEASTLTTAHVSRDVVLGVQHSQARLALRQGRWQEGAQVLAEALALCQARHTPYDEVQTLYLCGLLHLQQGETQPAREHLEAALAILHRLYGERLYTERVERALAGLER